MTGYVLTGYLVVLNITSFMLMGMDKRRAKKNVWRIRERTLFLAAFLGGSIGSLLGMHVFRHKTRHKRFLLGIPAILVLQLCIAWLVFMYTTSPW